MAPAKLGSRASSRKDGQPRTQMSWNNNNINTVGDNQPSVSSPSAADEADTISSRQLWQVIMRTQQVDLDLNLAEISAAWPTQPRPTVFALEQQLAGFRRHLRAGNTLVLRRGNINAALTAQSAATTTANTHAAATASAHTHVFSINSGASGNATSNASAHTHPHTGIIYDVQEMAGPSNASSHHAMNSGNAGWSSPPPLQIHRAKESQVPTASSGPPLGRVPAPDPPGRALQLSRTVSSRVVTRSFWSHPPRICVSYRDCGSLNCFYCYQRIMAER
ncbi:hypothetical protein BDV30DRAFT_246272 [Aspergillus minisclerotigenes]|uniref:Uncharacterized protein n=1 Tax=Aspergillus minisclerotigenes TaxID=656917 RepID=A0A5N6IMA9_9EURO|nr:hypothetical protein BDV30DRAFT_246272 [Aspergillus minisclerotigenes]